MQNSLLKELGLITHHSSLQMESAKKIRTMAKYPKQLTKGKKGLGYPIIQQFWSVLAAPTHSLSLKV